MRFKELGMGRWPGESRVLRTKFIKRTKLTKILTPAVMLTTVVILALASMVGIAVAGLVFGSRGGHDVGMIAAGSLLLLASPVTIVYIGFHVAATLGDEPVGVIRPPTLRIHAICFTIARISLLLWTIATVTSAAVVSKPSVCGTISRECKLQIIGITGSSLALLATGVLLTVLEICRNPFQMPETFKQGLITCRVSAFGSDISALDRSISPVSLYQGDYVIDARNTPRDKRTHSVVREKPEAEKTLPVPGEWPLERPLTRLQPMACRSSSRGWVDEWLKSNDSDGPWKVIKHQDSGISMVKSDSNSLQGDALSSLARSSTGDASTSDVEYGPRINFSRKQPRRQTVNSSTSTMNYSKRSPLSTMRSVKFPSVAVRPELRYLPPDVQHPHEWKLSRIASMPQLLPVGDIHTLRRLASSTSLQSLKLRGPNSDVSSLPCPSAAHQTRSKTLKRQITGSYVDLYHESILDEHMRKIEAEGNMGRQTQAETRPTGCWSHSGPTIH